MLHKSPHGSQEVAELHKIHALYLSVACGVHLHVAEAFSCPFDIQVQSLWRAFKIFVSSHKWPVSWHRLQKLGLDPTNSPTAAEVKKAFRCLSWSNVLIVGTRRTARLNFGWFRRFRKPRYRQFGTVNRDVTCDVLESLEPSVGSLRLQRSAEGYGTKFCKLLPLRALL